MTDIDLIYYVCIPSFSLLSGTLFGLLLSLDRRLTRFHLIREDLDLIEDRLTHLERNQECIDRLSEDIAHLLSVSSPHPLSLPLLERVHDDPSGLLPIYEEPEPSFLADLCVFPPPIPLLERVPNE